jgi:hypothetical protein
MDSSQKKNMVLIGVVVLLFTGAILAVFRDSIFSSTTKAPSVSETDAAAIAKTMGVKDNQPEPDAPNPPPRGSGKRPVGGK